MTNSVVLYIGGKELDITVGKGGVSKIFLEKESNNTNVVVLHSDGITVYGGFPFICEKSYAEKAEK